MNELRDPIAYSNQMAGVGLGNLLNDWMKEYGPIALFRTCASCTHMTPTGPAKCRLYDMTPPASVILSGCEKHSDLEGIPFD